MQLMKLFVLAVLPFALEAIQNFKNTNELIKCIMDCEEHVTPCLKDQDGACFKTYRECINKEDPYTCLASSNSLEISKIAQCFDTVCKEIQTIQEDEENQHEEDDDDDFNEVIIGQEEPATESEAPAIPATQEQQEAEELPEEQEYDHEEPESVKEQQNKEKDEEEIEDLGEGN